MTTTDYIQILPDAIASTIRTIEGITELRLRVGRRLAVQIWGVDRRLDYIVSRDDIDTIVARASNRSIYACQGSLAKGYLPLSGGVRIGICGEGVGENGKLVAVKNIQSLAIRIPHAIVGASDSLSKITDSFESTLIVSPPSAGKTTLLREMVRVMANGGTNVLLIDERGEISATVGGCAMLDVGESCDIVAHTPKSQAYESAVRSMNPSVIATDEIFGEQEVSAIIDVVRSGVKVLATVHGDSIESVLETMPYSRLAGVFRWGILLSKQPKIGSITTLIDLKLASV